MASAWTDLGSLPFSSNVRSGCLDSAGLVYCYGYDSATNSFYVFTYDPSTSAWAKFYDIGSGSADVLSVSVADSAMYAVYSATGGTPFALERMPLPSGTWTSVYSVPGSIAWPWSDLGSDGLIYAAIDSDGTTNYGNLAVVDPSTHTLVKTIAGPVVESYIGYCADSNGHLYAAGGNLSPGYDNRFWRYDITADTWTQLADLPYGIWRAGMVADTNGDVYCFGAWNTNRDQVCHKYSVATNTWSPLDVPPVPLWWAHPVIDRGTSLVYFPSYWTTDGEHDELLSLYVGPQVESAGGAATVTVTAIGSGRAAEQVAGAGAATVTVTATGTGATAVHQAGAGATTVTVTAIGSGRAAEQVAGAGAATVTVTATGTGQLASGISGAVQDFPDWVPPHIILATDNIIYRPRSAGDALPFRPTFVGLGGWASVIVIADVTATDTVATWRLALDWLVGGVSVRTVVVDALALPVNTAGLAGAQIITPAYSDELRVSVEADAALGQLAFTLAATTRQLPTLITPARFPDDSTIPAPAGTVSIPANSDVTVDIGPYSDALRLAVATDTDLTLTATTVAPVNGDGAAQQLASVDAAAAGVTALPVTWQGRVLRYGLHNGTAAAAIVTRQVDTVPA